MVLSTRGVIIFRRDFGDLPSDDNTVLFTKDVTSTQIKVNSSFCCSIQILNIVIRPTVYRCPLSKRPQARDNGLFSFLIESDAVDPFHFAISDVDELDASIAGHPRPRGQRRVVLNLLQVAVIGTPQKVSVEIRLEDTVSAASIVQGTYATALQHEHNAALQRTFGTVLQRALDTVL
jgi:hypothetical protein